MEGQHPLLPPQGSFEPHASHVSGSLIPCGFTPPQDWPLSQPGYIHFQAKNNLLVNDLAQSQQQSSQSLTRKRAPKAQTMSAKSWRPCEGRLKQLYVHDGKSIRELRETVNKEFGFTATERQYKAQVKKMNLKRNVKEEDQKAVVRCILHRTLTVGKKSSHVRVRGHKISPEKISRWIKDAVRDQPPTCTTPSSPLPSSISIYTNSTCVSPKLGSSALSEYQVQSLPSMSPKDMESTVMRRLLKYAQVPKHTIESQEAQAIFNDLQLILSCGPNTSTKHHNDAWNSTVEEDIIGVRNLMNMTQELTLNKGGGEIQQSSPAPPDQNLEANPSRGRHRHAAWMTPHGRVETAFWAVLNRSNSKVSLEDTADNSGEDLAARVAIIPSDPETHSFRVVFEFTPQLNLPSNLSYQAMIPNGSEVFNIVASGQVKELIEALENGTASLTDRDQQGRSLLNYAFWNARADMCKFLVDEKADVDAIEPNGDSIEFIGPINGLIVQIDAEEEEKQRCKVAECLKVMLEAGADTSIETYMGAGHWENTLMRAVNYRSFAALKNILDFGEPFISLNGTYNVRQDEKLAPLTALATSCGYYYANSIDIVDKAILLLQRGADMSCRRRNGDTVLHTLLKCKHLHERLSKADVRRCYGGNIESWNLSLRAPKDLLMVFITAGADVYAINNEGETPTMLASDFGRHEEWTEALELCGYDSKQVLAHLDSVLHDCLCERQTSKLSFEEYCLQRKENVRFEEIETDDEDEGSDEAEDDEVNDKCDCGEHHYVQHDYERTQLFAKATECRDEIPESYYGAEYIDHGMILGLEDAGYNCEDHFVGKINDHVVEPDDNLDFDISIGNGKDAMEDFFDSGNGTDALAMEDFFDFGNGTDALAMEEFFDSGNGNYIMEDFSGYADEFL